MFGPLLLLFLVVPLIELYLIIQVSSGFGLLPTIAMLILVSIVGAWLVRREGTNVIKRVQDQISSGKMPTNELIDGAMIVGGGALMLTPGFLTDIIGISLLLPPVRAILRPFVAKAVKSRVQIVSPFGGVMGDNGFGDGNTRGPGNPGSTGAGFGGFGGFGSNPFGTPKKSRSDVFDVDSTDTTDRGKLEPPDSASQQ